MSEDLPPLTRVQCAMQWREVELSVHLDKIVTAIGEDPQKLVVLLSNNEDFPNLPINELMEYASYHNLLSVSCDAENPEFITFEAQSFIEFDKDESPFTVSVRKDSIAQVMGACFRAASIARDYALQEQTIDYEILTGDILVRAEAFEAVGLRTLLCLPGADSIKLSQNQRELLEDHP